MADSPYQTVFRSLHFTMACILITGGTGLIGKALTEVFLRDGHQVIVMSRRKIKSHHNNLRFALWNPDKEEIEEQAIREADYAIHLAGANVAEKRWTKKRKQEIISSRVQSGKLLVQAIASIPNQISTLVSSSAIGYYGPDPSIPNPHPFQEENPPYHDFLSGVVKEWEAAIHPVTGLNRRMVIFRTGIVLSKEGGAYPEFLKPVKFKISTPFGNGRQVVSWIHIQDLVNLYKKAIFDNTISGVYNAVAPCPVSNRSFMKALGKEHHAILNLNIPSFVLKLVLGEMSIELLKSATVSADKIQNTGFEFGFPTIQEALKDLNQLSIKV